jgi:hypothetical protein
VNRGGFDDALQNKALPRVEIAQVYVRRNW